MRDDTKDEMICLEELRKAQDEVAKAAGEQRPASQNMFRAI